MDGEERSWQRSDGGNYSIWTMSLYDWLHTACVHHTDGLMAGDVSLQTCWDADRQDLERVRIRPKANRLCTDAARDCIEWASYRARRFHFDDGMRWVWA